MVREPDSSNQFCFVSLIRPVIKMLGYAFFNSEIFEMT